MLNQPERAGTLNGIPGRFSNVIADSKDAATFIAQKWISEARPISGYGPGRVIRAEARFDDQCKNGHNTFSLTGYVERPGARDWDTGGCIHDEIAKAFPELAPLIAWHLTSSDGPMHYVGNTVYFAGDRDHNGLRAGESRQIINGRSKLPCWKLEVVNAPGTAISSTPTADKYRDCETVPLFIVEDGFDGLESDLPPAPALQWVPLLRHGEGKPRDLDAARRAAVWPDATDAELMVEPEELKAALIARHPALMERFKADIVAAGFFWSPATA